MIKSVSKILIIAAGLFLLLHTFVPHEHHGNVADTQSVTEYQSAKSLFDYLKLAFHFDQGDHHLEEYNTASFFTVEFLLFPSAEFDFAIKPKLLTVIDHSFRAVKEEVPDNPLPKQLQYRGPPSLIS